MMLLLVVAGAAALVAPGARPPRAVVCGGATYDYCVQALGCTMADASKVERSLMADMAKYMTYAKAEEKCVWLQSRLDLDEGQLRKIIIRQPAVLGSSVEVNMAPKLDWLQTCLDLNEAQLKKMVMTLPQLLGLSVEDNLAPTLEWLQRRLDLDPAELKNVLLGVPPLLGLSVDNMAPKLAYLEQEIGLSPAELRDWVVKNPTLLGRSLANRYRPRLEACRAAGVDVKRVLSYATQTDETFCKCIGIEPGALEAIRKQSVLSV